MRNTIRICLMDTAAAPRANQSLTAIRSPPALVENWSLDCEFTMETQVLCPSSLSDSLSNSLVQLFSALSVACRGVFVVIRFDNLDSAYDTRLNLEDLNQVVSADTSDRISPSKMVHLMVTYRLCITECL